jgi:hypothetical protein
LAAAFFRKISAIATEITATTIRASRINCILASFCANQDPLGDPEGMRSKYPGASG